MPVPRSAPTSQATSRATKSALYSANFASATAGYAAYIDVDSAIQYCLANDLVKNVDGNLQRSTYLFKPRDGKLHFGPLWDFDLAIGNATYDGAPDPQGWYIRNAPCFARMFEDPAFAARVAQEWRAVKRDGRLDALLAYVARRAIEPGDAQARNFGAGRSWMSTILPTCRGCSRPSWKTCTSAWSAGTALPPGHLHRRGSRQPPSSPSSAQL